MKKKKKEKIKKLEKKLLKTVSKIYDIVGKFQLEINVTKGKIIGVGIRPMEGTGKLYGPMSLEELLDKVSSVALEDAVNKMKED